MAGSGVLEPGRQRSDTAPGRIDDDGVRRLVRIPRRYLARVERAERGVVQAVVSGGARGARDRLGRHLDPQHLGARQRPRRVQGEPAHPAVQVPRRRRHTALGDPRRRRRVQPLGHRGVRLEEPLRAQPQAHPVEPHGQRRPAGEHDLLVALGQGHVLGQQVRAHHGGGCPARREVIQQPRHRRAQRVQPVGGAQHEPDHRLPVGGERHDHVLQLARAGGDVVGLQPGRRHRRRARLEHALHAGLVQAAVAQVHAGAVVMAGVLPRVQDAQPRRRRRPRDHELRLVPEPGLRGGERLGHDRVRIERVRQRGQDRGLLVRELPGVRHAHQRAGTALADVEVGALHGRRLSPRG